MKPDVNSEIKAEIASAMNIINASDLGYAMTTQIVPYLERAGHAFSLTAADGHVISGMYYLSALGHAAENGRGTIVISHGFTESFVKYREMIYYFLLRGYDVCIHDHRGHGLSRDGKTPGGATHIDRFQSYVDDLALVIEKIVPQLSSPAYLFAHSMGGLVGARYVQQHPETFAKAIFSSPMFEINRGGLPYPVAKAAASLLCLVGKGKDFLPGQGEFSSCPNFEGSASTCRERYNIYLKEQAANPNLQNGGSSCRWALESFKTDELLLKKEALAAMKLPILLFQADKDDFVYPGGQNRFIEGVPSGRLVFMPGTKHEIYMSDDETLAEYLNMIFTFLRN